MRAVCEQQWRTCHGWWRGLSPTSSPLLAGREVAYPFSFVEMARTVWTGGWLPPPSKLPVSTFETTPQIGSKLPSSNPKLAGLHRTGGTERKHARHLELERLCAYPALTHLSSSIIQHPTDGEQAASDAGFRNPGSSARRLNHRDSGHQGSSFQPRARIKLPRPSPRRP